MKIIPVKKKLSFGPGYKNKKKIATMRFATKKLMTKTMPQKIQKYRGQKRCDKNNIEV